MFKSKNAKKVLALVLVVILVLSLAACKPKTEDSTVASTIPETVTVPVSTLPETVTAPVTSTAPETTTVPPVEPVDNKVLRLSTTTSVNDSGLLGYLQKEFEADTGYTLEVTSAGTGAAIAKGASGDADALLVHAQDQEEAFIGAGFGEERVPFMFNYFVIIGPAADPAGVKDCTSASEAFKKIAENKDAKFVSRGDNSGTHSAENNLWKLANITPTGQAWYVSTGQGMGASINVASEQGAYILTDKATYLSHAQKDKFEILLEESDEMQNTYAMIAISDKRWKDTNAKAAAAFIEWMQSDKAINMINSYGVAEYGEKLFYCFETALTSDGNANKILRLSTTTSVNDSGLLGYLQKEFEADTGYTLEVTSAGTGAAIAKGASGDADALLVHAQDQEEAFIGAGFGEERVPFMFNYFVIIGPAADPAGVKDCTSASEAFKKIAENKDAKFVSRGDNSGTHSAENNLWKLANITPTGQAWYVSTGQGMGASINVASEQGAYILTDKATYLSHAQKDKFEILLEESDEMMNTYAMIAISDKRWKDTNAAGAASFIEWMQSEKAVNMINNYGVEAYGEKLFYCFE